MKVVHFSTKELCGGAAIAANRLHVGLQGLGVDSRMIVGTRHSQDPSVMQIALLRGPINRVKRQLDRTSQQSEHRQYQSTKLPTLEMFSDDRVPGPERLLEHIPRDAVTNLHWVAGFLDYKEFFTGLPANQPLVWTFHDMNAFTGGCHYTLGCDRFERSCGGCPQLGSTRKTDISRRIFARKKNALEARPSELTQIVAPSRWLASQAASSSLLSRFPIRVIPYGLDCTVFQPRESQVARETFGLGGDRPILMFAAESIDNHRKGFDLLESTLAIVQAQRNVTLAAIGAGNSASRIGGIQFLGKIDHPRVMSLALSAANVFVMPTRADNLPNVVLEAMACGIPIAGFDVGGMPDMVRSGLTGQLARPEDPTDLARCIIEMLDSPAQMTSMGATARAVAVSEYGLSVQALRYKALYEELEIASGAFAGRR